MRVKQNRRNPRILIAGLGNILLRDDGIGVHAVRALEQLSQPGVLVAEVGTAVLDALHLFEWADRILAIDAMKAGGAAGTLYSLGVADIEDGGVKTSLHELSLLAALRFLPNGRRREIAILGIEPEIIDYGLELSPKAEAALPAVIRSIRAALMNWGVEPGRNGSSRKKGTEIFLDHGTAANPG